MASTSLGFPVGSVVKNLPAMQELQEMQVWSLGWEDPLGEGMATHSSILAWRILRTEEPGGLQSIGSQRVGHDWSDLAHMHTWPVNNVVIISGGQQGDSAIHICVFILPQTPLLSRLAGNIEQRPLCAHCLLFVSSYIDRLSQFFPSMWQNNMLLHSWGQLRPGETVLSWFQFPDLRGGSGGRSLGMGAGQTTH